MTWKNIVAGLLDKDELRPLPEPFLFGVATSDHQCEAYDPKYEDIRDIWEHDINPDAARGKASNFWNRYQEDIELAKGLGCNAFRFSIAWSRVEPAPGQFNQEALDHYGNLIDKIRSCGMQPILTLHHFTWPIHVEERGGMIAEHFPDVYANYVREVARHFAKDVSYWITFNEPNLLIGGYLKPWWEEKYAAPPGLSEDATSIEVVDVVGKLIRNLFLSHKRAYEIVKAENPHARVGVNAFVLGLPLWLKRLVNRKIFSLKGDKEVEQMINHVKRMERNRGRMTKWLMANLFEKSKVDVILATLTKTFEREQVVMFSQPYFVAGLQLLVESESIATCIDDFREKPIAVVESSVAETKLRKLIEDAKALRVPDYDSALRKIDLEQAQALLGDNTILHGLMTQHPGKYRLIDKLLTQDEVYAGAIRKGENDLLMELDSTTTKFRESPIWLEWSKMFELPLRRPPRAMRSIFSSPRTKESVQRKTEQIQKMMDEPSDPMPMAPEGTAMRRIQDRGFLVAAIKSDVPGFSYMNPETEEFSGLEVDLARSFARFIFGDANKVHFSSVKVKNRIPLLQLGLLDTLQRNYSILSTVLYYNDWWHLGMSGELDEYLCPPDCKMKMDFVGLDYFWGISTLKLGHIQSLIDAVHYGRYGRAPVYQMGLYNNLMYYQQKFPGLPLIIFGNGSLKMADGVDRETYINRHIREIQRAVQEGVIVDGYIYSSLTSQSDWNSKSGDINDFGLFHIDLDSDPSLSRMRTPAADAYKEIIKKRGV